MNSTVQRCRCAAAVFCSPVVVMVCVLLVGAAFVLPAAAAPELSESDRQRIEDGTTPRGSVIDREDGFYVMLRNAKQWPADDFAGEAGAAIAPTPDYDYLLANPEKVLGNVYLIEGIFVQQVRYPTGGRALFRSGYSDWGDRVTRWAIRTSDDPDDTVLVFFNDPDGQIQPPEEGANVRVAARFHKVWMTETAEGKPARFLTFVGGAHEVVSGPAGGKRFGTGGAMTGIVVALILMSIAAFFVVRFLMNRKVAEGAGGRTRAYLEARRRERESLEEDDDDDDELDLPEDPAEAMRVLQERHDAENPPTH